MMQLLCTKIPDQQFTLACEQAEITLEIIPFIKVSPIVSYELGKLISAAALEPSHVAFTSSNAVEAVHNYLQGLQPEWNIYCTAPATQRTVQQLLPSAVIVTNASNAEDLAQQMIASGHDQFLFFCGDQRRAELPDALKSSNISVKEIIVYKTIATPVTLLKEEYDAIAFFSPSAVTSFFSVNKLPDHTVLFCTGNTTAAAIDKSLANKVIISPDPSQAAMAQLIIRHFRENPVAGNKVRKLNE